MSLSPLSRKLLEKYAAEAEFRRCQRDQDYFLEHYWHIPSESDESGRSLFQLFDYQKHDLEVLRTHQRVVFGKSRQLGLTTTAMAASGAELLLSKGRYELLVVSKSDNDAQTNLGMIKFGHQWLPEWMKRRMPQRIDDNAAVMTLRDRDGREVKATSMVGTPKRGAGKTATRIVLDEHALMEKGDNVYRSLDAATTVAIAAGRDRGDLRAVFVIISTFRGAHNTFANLFKTAWFTPAASAWKAVFHGARENRFMPTEFGLRWETMTEAEFDAAWNRKRLSEYQANEQQFFQEYPRTVDEALKETGNARFPNLPPAEECGSFPYAGYLVQRGEKITVDLLDEDDDGWDLAPWRFAVAPSEWDRKKTYVIGADPSSGSGKDYSVAYVMARGDDPEETEVVAYYSSNAADPATFASDLAKTGRYFRGEGQPHGAVLAVERSNDQSGIVINQLQSNLRYRSLFRYTAKDRVSARVTPVIGWPQDRKTKPEAIDALARQFEKRKDETGAEYVHTSLIGIGPELREQLGNFVVEVNPTTGNVKMRADGNGHDDHVMSAAITLAVLERTRPRKKHLTEEPKGEGIPLPFLEGAFVQYDGAAPLRDAKALGRQLQEQADREWLQAERDRHRDERYERTRA